MIVATSYLLDAGPGFSLYSWSTGETTQSILVGTPDTYCVTVSDSNTCSNNDCVFIDISNGIQGVLQSKLYSVYPNPVTDRILINLTHRLSNAEIELKNSIGKLIKKIDVNNSDEISIDLSAFPKGIYFLRLNADNYSDVMKIIFQ